MKKSLSLFLIILLVLSLTACTNTEPAENSDMSQEEQIVQSENEDTSIQGTNDKNTNESEPAAEEPKPAIEAVKPATEKLDPVTEEVENTQMKLQIGDYIFTASLADNSSVEALKEMLEAGPITIDMHDYGNMEKVGSLGTSLPRNDEQITTGPGDLILYQGNAFVIYYASNSWNFTRLGKINDVTQDELKEALGSGDVQVTLSLN